LLLFIGGFTYLIIDFRVFPFHLIFSICLTGLLLQIYEKKNRKIFAVGAAGYLLIILSAIFVVNASKVPLFYELLKPNQESLLGLLSTASLLALLPAGYVLLTIASNRVGILDNFVSMILGFVFIINYIPYLNVPRISFGFAIIILGYLSLQNLRNK
jgi:cbb3-type cytochrome oxidase subunit 3